MSSPACAVRVILLTSILTMSLPGIAATGPYDALDQLPDWTGWWYSPPPSSAPGAGPPTAPPPRRTRPPLNAGAQARIDKANASGSDPGTPGGYCQPFRFIGDNGTMTGFEILFTPGRVTITNELGLVRRIFTDGRTFDANQPESITGNAVGHWEGATLVVATTGLDHTAAYPNERTAGASEIGTGASVSERIFLKDPNTLEIDSTLVAPKLLTAPYHTTQLYQRDRHYTPEDKSACVKNDRLVDPTTGKQRFDLTPPPDLPPPPQ